MLSAHVSLGFHFKSYLVTTANSAEVMCYSNMFPPAVTEEYNNVTDNISVSEANQHEHIVTFH